MQIIRSKINGVMGDFVKVDGKYSTNLRGFRGHVLDMVLKTIKGSFSFRHRISNGCGYNYLRGLNMTRTFRDGLK